MLVRRVTILPCCTIVMHGRRRKNCCCRCHGLGWAVTICDSDSAWSLRGDVRMVFFDLLYIPERRHIWMYKVVASIVVLRRTVYSPRSLTTRRLSFVIQKQCVQTFAPVSVNHGDAAVGWLSSHSSQLTPLIRFEKMAIIKSFFRQFFSVAMQGQNETRKGWSSVPQASEKNGSE